MPWLQNRWLHNHNTRPIQQHLKGALLDCDLVTLEAT